MCTYDPTVPVPTLPLLKPQPPPPPNPPPPPPNPPPPPHRPFFHTCFPAPVSCLKQHNMPISPTAVQGHSAMKQQNKMIAAAMRAAFKVQLGGADGAHQQWGCCLGIMADAELSAIRSAVGNALAQASQQQGLRAIGLVAYHEVHKSAFIVTEPGHGFGSCPMSCAHDDVQLCVAATRWAASLKTRSVGHVSVLSMHSVIILPHHLGSAPAG